MLSAVRVRDFQFRGRPVFSHADEQFHVKLMIKHLDVPSAQRHRLTGVVDGGDGSSSLAATDGSDGQRRND